MTKFELSVILKLIDLHTQYKSTVYGNDYPYIPTDEIPKLKNDIKELFENDNDNK